MDVLYLLHTLYYKLLIITMNDDDDDARDNSDRRHIVSYESYLFIARIYSASS